MLHWLDRYASDFHKWRRIVKDGKAYFYRPLGLVETAFDADGEYFEGRADINAQLDLQIHTTLRDAKLRERLVLTWTALRLHHVLLMATCIEKHKVFHSTEDPNARVFLISRPEGAQEAIDEASQNIIFVRDHYADIDHKQLYRHAQNTGRVIDASRSLAKVFVLQNASDSNGKSKLSFLFVMGHQITDGMANSTWLSHFIKLLNMPLQHLQKLVSTASTVESMQIRLPLPQEDLYPPINGSKAQKRWFWALTVVLRHVRKSQPAAFTNPLYRPVPLGTAETPQPSYNKLLDYTKTPPLNSFTISAHIPAAPTRRLHSLCREASTSIGAGCFVLVAMVMMSLYESKYPNILDSERLPFIGSFPVNPRQFFNHFELPDSMMLAFSDGVVLPFLPSSLPFDSRFRLLVRQAHRQLSVFQKRSKTQVTNMKAHMLSSGAGRIIAMNYILATERANARLPPHLRRAELDFNPQGSLAAHPNPTMATCGVSSVGRSAWKIGEYDVDAELPEGDDAFVADYRSSQQNVRARNGEFLVGIGGDDENIHASVSYDGNAIDEQSVNEWKERMEMILEENNLRSKL